MRRMVFSLVIAVIASTSLSSCSTSQRAIPHASSLQVVPHTENPSTRYDQFIPDVTNLNDFYVLKFSDGRALKFPGSARIGRLDGHLRVNGPGYQFMITAPGVRRIDHLVKGRTVTIKPEALPYSCVNLDNCCTMNCGGGVGGCDASHQSCGPCPDCGGPIQHDVGDDIECYYGGRGTCGDDQFGNPFGTLIMRFPGIGGGLGTTCLWDVSDDAFAAGTDLSCMDDEPNILNAPFNGNVVQSYTWSRSRGATTIVCGAASPQYVTQVLFNYREVVNPNLTLTAEKVLRNVLPGQTVTETFTPSLGPNSIANGTYTYRAVALRIAAFCNGAGAIPVP